MPVGVVVYFVCTSGIIFYLFHNWAYDDPYITYRYAQNLANGLGFVYNPGEPVLSTTTPLFTLLLAALSVLWKNLPYLANLIGAMSIALGALLIYWLAEILGEPMVGWAGLLLYPISQLLLNCVGSETPLYIAFCIACFGFYWRSNYTVAAIFSALAVLTRPDGLLVPVILAAHYLIRIRHPIPWKPLITFFSLVLPWLLFAWVYFGSPIPATLAAKQHQGFMTISQQFGAGFMTLIYSYSRLWYYKIQAGAVFLGVVYMVLKSRRWIVFIAWPVVYFIAFMLLGVTRYFWYYAPLLPGFVVLVGLGVTSIERILRSQTEKVHNPDARISNIPRLTAMMMLLIPGFFQMYQVTTKVGAEDPRTVVYKAVGDWLHSNTLPNASIGTLEVGIIGFYADRPMIDFAGLIQPEISSQFKHNTTYADSANYAVEHFRPAYLVIREGTFQNLENGYAAQNCRIAKRFLGANYNYYSNLVVYECSQSG